ncbi:MAG: hypothetical protein EA369_00950 [Bradymonadales bacterium]|nr:MAG: hypothetical protein EA369_00950 [Bradymonadales bacterium]
MSPDSLSPIFMILGFLLASYSVVANDSLQTLGTFIASQSKRISWTILWIATSSVMVVVLLWSWWSNDGDISYGRLQRIARPEIFQWWHAAAPALLLLMTRVGIPVSTTFLVLSVFAAGDLLQDMLFKSILGYSCAAVFAYCFWWVLSRFLNERERIENPKTERAWRITQWIATSALWASWLSHDMANVAVYLPRSLSVGELIFTLAVLTSGLAYVFWARGGSIQKVVLDKSGTRFVRSATIIDFAYAFVLYFFKEMNDIPMSTTWVFVGLLCGREFAVYRQHDPQKVVTSVFPIVAKDFLKIFLGLALSVLLVLIVAALDKSA